ncbi:beta-1,3-galactosyl-O-glycosyl-glycoprotein beta-1,6-N-acetylglucosaminyltransferase 3-like [Gigantopelta aegis]|uniref:beta-1,3-galactosyl-O-glycosyl-glycoprotein beta-1,6-N-acetylglucosaminyltransferase 3-like n=1 Tax=Gigantopelta aegis TaxID=1735272 RepID=UPI001B887CF1|nr:beta-1,3-galactosyl-O-glycosyl-glycoprotein beta-1,6-N-acetylglucosaminyltransferase 3-like [Gigantopelta aegis]
MAHDTHWAHRILFVLLVIYVVATFIHFIVPCSTWKNSFDYLRQIVVVEGNKTSKSSQTKSMKPEKQLDVCSRLIEGDLAEVQRSVNRSRRQPRRVKLLETYPSYTEDCSAYVNEMGFITNGVSGEEKEFPIAFTILAYKHAEQVERLLRAVYRPHNVYCVHVDSKAPALFKDAIRSIVKCLPNVFLAPRSINVVWGTYSVLEPELLCMDRLLKHRVRWKYLINLTGQEFPLRTNRELVTILQIYRGANDISGGYKRANTHRWKNIDQVPHGIVPRKGSVHIAASRGYVQYVRSNKTAMDFLDWVKKTKVPDETFFATFNYNPHLKVPGSYKGEVDDGKRVYLTRYKVWLALKDVECHSAKYVREVCIFGIGDLHTLTTVPHLFANKFHWEFQPLVLDCLEKWYFDKVSAEKRGIFTFNTTIYEQRHFIKNAFI